MHLDLPRTLPMDDVTAELLQRIERCEREVQVSRGYIKGLEYGLLAVIAASPEPERLLVLWRQVVDAYVESDAAGESKMHHLATRQAMDVVGDHIRAAVRKRKH